MTNENHNEEMMENSEFDFFDFSDVDPFFAKRNAVANEILSLISHEKISKKELSDKLDWAPSRLSKVLSGEQNITIKTITAISLALGYDFSIYFHKIFEKEMVQPWEQLSEVSTIVHSYIFNEIKEPNINVNIHIQSKDEVISDLFYGCGKETYFSLSVNSKITESKAISNKKNNTNSMFLNDLSKMKTFSLTPKKVVNNHG